MSGYTAFSAVIAGCISRDQPFIAEHDVAQHATVAQLRLAMTLRKSGAIASSAHPSVKIGHSRFLAETESDCDTHINGACPLGTSQN